MKTTFDNQWVDIEITHDEQFQSWTVKPLADFVRTIEEMNEKILLKTVDFDETTPGSGVYAFKFEANDGRKWSQDIVFDAVNPDDPMMSFNITDHWRFSEFVFQRIVRDAFIALRNQYKVTKVKCDFTNP